MVACDKTMTDQERAVKFAEKVLGWTKDCCVWRNVEGEIETSTGGFDPCTDLNQAWLGVEKLAPQGWWLIFNTQRYGEDSQAEMVYEQDGVVTVELAVSSRPACAILEACLQAVGAYNDNGD